MHGQYDWTRDPALDSQPLRVGHRLHRRRLAPLAQLRAPHVHQHPRQGSRHRLRLAARQPRAAVASGAPGAAAGRARPRVRVPVGRRRARPARRRARRRQAVARRASRGAPARSATKAAWQLGKDYAFYPGAGAWNAPRVLAGNLLANVARNLWTFAVIFCGHFPDGVQVFREEETRGREPRPVVRAPAAAARPTSRAAAGSTS